MTAVLFVHFLAKDRAVNLFYSIKLLNFLRKFFQPVFSQSTMNYIEQFTLKSLYLNSWYPSLE